MADSSLSRETLKRRPRRALGAERRELIIRTAARLFRERGYERTSVRDLAEAVGIQSGSLFYHFESKEQILFAVFRNGLNRVIERLDQFLADAEAPKDKLLAIFYAHLEAVLVRDRDAFTVILTDWRSLSPESRSEIVALRDQYESRVKGVLSELAQAKLIKLNPELVRLFILGALNWTVEWYRPNGRLKVDELAQEFLSIFWDEME